MYPIFSPCKLNIQLKLINKNTSFYSPKIKFSSNSKSPLSINVNEFVDSKKLKDISAFTLIEQFKGFTFDF